MLTNEQALYQTKLILDCLPKSEYNLIPKETIKHIKENMKIDKNITIDKNKELEKQNLDDKTIIFLNEILTQVDFVKELIENKKDEKEELKTENIRLHELNEMLKKENTKIPQAKSLILEYKNLISLKEKELLEVKELNYDLNENINKIPKFIKKIFIKKGDIKYLEGKDIEKKV